MKTKVTLLFPDPQQGPWRLTAEVTKDPVYEGVAVIFVRLRHGLDKHPQANGASYSEDFTLFRSEEYRQLIPAEIAAEIRNRSDLTKIPLPPISEVEALLEQGRHLGLLQMVRNTVWIVRELPVEEVLRAVQEVYVEEVMES